MPDNLTLVRQAAARLSAAETRVKLRRDQLAQTIRDAHSAGEKPIDLIDASGLSRQTVFNALKGGQQQPVRCESDHDDGTPHALTDECRHPHFVDREPATSAP